MHTSMKTVRLATTLLILLTLIPLSLPAAAGVPDVVFEGHGWGHGMGMSQWGAYARALEGQSAEEIVTTYYQTTSMVPSTTATSAAWYHDDPTPVWVNMLGSSPYSSPSSFKIRASSDGLTICQQEPRGEAIWSLSRNGADQSVYVEILEKRLDELGHNPGFIDGWFDSDTVTAVKGLQSANGLAVDGIVGRNTKTALWEPDSGDRCVIETPLPTSTITVTSDDVGNCTVPGAEAVGDCLGSVRGLEPGKHVVLPQKLDGGAAVELAHGNLRIRPDLDSDTTAFEGIHVVLEVGMEDYVAGVDEVPNWWVDAGANEALKAQAIAARTYGLRHVLSYGELGKVGGSEYPYTDTNSSFAIKRDHCWCHLYSNTYSQVYSGWTRETETGGTWPAAVVDTVDSGSGSGYVLTAPGHGVIWALYTSSNGGASEAHNDHYGYSPPSNFSYLVSVPDPYSLTPANPFANWTKTLSAAYVASRVGLDELVGVDVTATNESGSARTVAFRGYKGDKLKTIEKTGGWVDSAFGLRSKYFDVNWGDMGSQPEPEPEPSPEYTDISDSIFKGDILWAAANGIAFGCNPPENDRFCPKRSVSREEMALFMTKALHLPAASKDYFTDDEASPYEDAINRMAEARITRGCNPPENDRFCPDRMVDRGQMAAFLGRAFGLTDNGGGDLFIDDDTSIFENDIDRLGTAGITRGCNPPANTRFCPTRDVTRGAMMAFLHRAIGG